MLITRHSVWIDNYIYLALITPNYERLYLITLTIANKCTRSSVSYSVVAR
jgi:hypothetical protein